MDTICRVIGRRDIAWAGRVTARTMATLPAILNRLLLSDGESKKREIYSMCHNCVEPLPGREVSLLLGTRFLPFPFFTGDIWKISAPAGPWLLFDCLGCSLQISALPTESVSRREV